MVAPAPASLLPPCQPDLSAGQTSKPARRGAAPRRGPVRPEGAGRGGEGSAPGTAGRGLIRVSKTNVLHGTIASPLREIIWDKADSYDRLFLAGVFGSLPFHIARPLLREWEAVLAREGRKASNLFALRVRDELYPELFPERGLRLDASDDMIRDQAHKIAKSFRANMATARTQGALEALIASTLRCYGVKAPTVKTPQQIAARLSHEAWWRRAIRRRYQAVEAAAIRTGLVHEHAARYITEQAFKMFEHHQRSLRRLLEKLEAVNERTGEVLPLVRLWDQSLANPTWRRGAMMSTVRGLEERAKELGFAAFFLTITCPSRMHAQRWKGGRNPHYDGTSPTLAQRYLAREVWNRATSALKNLGIKPREDYFGIRVVEPHHDATPHWHVLLFCSPTHAQVILDTFWRYALADSPEDQGAQQRRMKIEPIKPSLGSATGYIAKYIAKQLDGKHVGQSVEEQESAVLKAKRIVAWARIWRIRQFQFFGVGALTPFRELYRVEQVPASAPIAIAALLRAAKDLDFAAFIRIRDQDSVLLRLLQEPVASTRYPGEMSTRAFGVRIAGGGAVHDLITRPDAWTIRPGVSALTTLDPIQ